MWSMAVTEVDTDERRAERGQLQGLAELTDEEYETCLEKTSRYLMLNRMLRVRGQQVLIKPDMGRAASASRGRSSRITTARAAAACSSGTCGDAFAARVRGPAVLPADRGPGALPGESAGAEDEGRGGGAARRFGAVPGLLDAV